MTSLARQHFLQLIRQPDRQIPLAEAALAIAWEDQGGATPLAALDELEQLALRLRVRLPADAEGQISAMRSALFDEGGLYGDPSCYERQEPANSYLDQVLRRRTGLPIMLSLIYLELGWQLGLPVSGLALPGHFLVRWADPDGDRYIDPFRGGALWSRADCERQIATFYGRTTPELIDWLMQPPSRSAILARILRNLKQTHLALGNVRLALAAVERLLLIDGGDAGELRDRGLLRFRAGFTYPALEDLERYARRSPAATDLGQIRAFAHDLIGKLAPRN